MLKVFGRLGGEGGSFILQNEDVGAKRPIFGRIGGAEQGDCMKTDCRGEVSDAAVISNIRIGDAEDL